MTPEGRTKARIKKLLVNKGVWFYMPVQTGYGNTELDFICARKIRISDQRAWFHTWEIFLIEAKAHGQNPTPRQAAIIEAHRAAGRKVFVIDDEHASLVPKHDSLEELNKWLDSL